MRRPSRHSCTRSASGRAFRRSPWHRSRAPRLGTLDRGRAGGIPRLRRPGEALGSARGGRSVRLPAGYTLLGSAPVRAAIREDLVPLLGAWLLAPSLVLPAGAEPIAAGRGAAYRVELPGGVRAVVRLYRRGGLVARAVRQTYLGLRPRPLRELAITAEARRRGVAAVEVLAARVDGRLAYRGALVTA